MTRSRLSISASRNIISKLTRCWRAIALISLACTLVYRVEDCDYVLLLHEDAEIAGDAVSRLAHVLEWNAEVGAVCPLFSGANAHAPEQVRKLPTPSDPGPAWRPADGEEAVYA